MDVYECALFAKFCQPIVAVQTGMDFASGLQICLVHLRLDGYKKLLNFEEPFVY